MFDLQTAKGVRASDLPILQDDRVHWNGQPVAVVVADTLEQAEHAASLVARRLRRRRAGASLVRRAQGAAVVPKDILGEPPEVTIGDADKALAEAAVTRGSTSTGRPGTTTTPSSRTPRWRLWDDDDTLTVYDSTQCLRRFSGIAGASVRARRRTPSR